MQGPHGGLICLAPVNHLLSGLSAYRAGLCDLFLIERHASGCCCSIFFDLELALLAAAPHHLYKAGLVSNSVLELVIGLNRVDMVFQMCLCTGKHIILHLLKSCLDGFSQVTKLYKLLFSGVTANDNCLACFDILRADLNTQRDTLDFLLTEFPAGCLVRSIDPDAQTCC